MKDNGEFEDGSELAYKLEYEESSRECEEKCNAEAACVGFVDYEDMCPKYCSLKPPWMGTIWKITSGETRKKLEVTSYYVRISTSGCRRTATTRLPGTKVCL